MTQILLDILWAAVIEEESDLFYNGLEEEHS